MSTNFAKVFNKVESHSGGVGGSAEKVETKTDAEGVTTVGNYKLGKNPFHLT